MTIISHTHRMIFLRTRKTASTSIEYALLPHLSPHDFISTSKGAEPLDHPWWRTTNRTTRLANEPELKEKLARFRRLRRFGIYLHEPARGVRRAVRPAVWNEYIKIAVERHPYDRVISMWQWRTRQHEQRPSIDRFLRFLEQEKQAAVDWRGRGSKWQLYSNWPIYAIGDEVVADQLIRWEDLAVELPKILAELGIHSIQLGRHKARNRDPEATLDLLDDEARERIYRLYQREFETLGYER